MGRNFTHFSRKRQKEGGKKNTCSVCLPACLTMSQGAIVSLNKNTLENEGGCWGSRGAARRKETYLKESIVSERKLLHQIEMCTQNTREGECACEGKDSQSESERGSAGGLSVFNILELCRKISKTDARISFECRLAWQAGRLALVAGQAQSPRPDHYVVSCHSVSLLHCQSVLFFCFIAFSFFFLLTTLFVCLLAFSLLR